MNYAAVDDRCENLVSVGDSQVAYLHQATPAGMCDVPYLVYLAAA